MTVQETIKMIYTTQIPRYESIFVDYVKIKDKDNICKSDFLLASAMLFECCRHGIRGIEEHKQSFGDKEVMFSKAVLMMACKDYQEILSERFEDGMSNDAFLKLAHSVADEMMSDEFLENKAEEIIKTITKAG